jgi:hypothetical protein
MDMNATLVNAKDLRASGGHAGRATVSPTIAGAMTRISISISARQGCTGAR